MNVITFLKRLVGPSESELKESDRFERNIKSADQQAEELDRVQESMSGILERVSKTQRRIKASTASSHFSGEHALFLQQLRRTEEYDERDGEEGTDALGARGSALSIHEE